MRQTRKLRGLIIGYGNLYPWVTGLTQPYLVILNLRIQFKLAPLLNESSERPMTKSAVRLNYSLTLKVVTLELG